MLYLCPTCDRSVENNEILVYCPFCGHAYASNIPAQQNVQISIGSDSERTVQEKYWLRSRKWMHTIFALLWLRIYDSGKRSEVHYNWFKWMQESRQCNSVTQFKKRCEDLLGGLGAGFRHNADMEQESLDLKQWGDFIDGVCLRLAASFKSEARPMRQPALKYVETPAKGTQYVALAEPPEDYHHLLLMVQESKALLFRVVDECGLFAAFPPSSDFVDDDSLKKTPMELVESLKTLSKHAYAPLFGMDSDAFIVAFWESVLLLMEQVNNTYQLLEMDSYEKKKLEALEGYLADWQNYLDMLLDQTYQDHDANMMLIFSDVDKTLKGFQNEMSSSVE